MTAETFNAAGQNGRDCPVCYRVGSLTGLRDGDAPRLRCSGCYAMFVLTWRTQPTMPDTLTRVPMPAPAAGPGRLL